MGHADIRKKANDAFEDFLFELCAHVRVVGGTGNPDKIRREAIEDLFKTLYPNDIILGFRNNRMKGQYQLSYKMRD